MKTITTVLLTLAMGITVAWARSTNNPCIIDYTTNICVQAPSVALGAVTLSNSTVCLGSPVSASTTMTSSNGSYRTDTIYTNCPTLAGTNLYPVAPSITVSWVASGPGGYTTSGSGTNATFSPTAAGTGNITFYCQWTSPPPCTDSGTLSNSASYTVIKVELTPTTRVGCPRCLTNLLYSLTNSFVPNGVAWSISPSALTGGATVTPNGNQAAVSAGTVGTNYTIRATSVDNTNCYADANLTVYTPGLITQTGNSYTDTATESHKVIRHSFSPSPAGDAAANHFCFVQRIKGSFQMANGDYFTGTVYGIANVPMNFTNWVIDSLDDDPAYWSPPHNAHSSAGGNVYYVSDDPGPALSSETNCVYKADFTIGIYCALQVPTSGCAAQPSTGTPFDTKTWDYKVTVTTNATFTHP